MFRFTLRRADTGQTCTVDADSRDILRWERQKPGRAACRLVAEWSMVDFYALAHLAAQRQGLLEGVPLREFEETYLVTQTTQIDLDDGPPSDEGGPTSADRSTET